MSTIVNSNCKIGPLPAAGHEVPPIPPVPDTREIRVAKIKAEASEIMRKADKPTPRFDLPPLPDKLPGPDEQPMDAVDVLKLIELRKRAAKLPAIEDVTLIPSSE